MPDPCGDKRATPVEALPTDGVTGGFAHAVAMLAAGELTFAFPFDLATSAALARNASADVDAVRQLFDAAAPGTHYQIQVSIHEVIPGVPEVPPREVLDTIAGPDATIVLLAGLIHELLQRSEAD